MTHGNSWLMSELCRFHGIVIRIFAPDHPPPHFHAIYAEYEAQIDIRSLEIVEGYLPSRSRRLVLEWASMQQRFESGQDRAVELNCPDAIHPVEIVVCRALVSTPIPWNAAELLAGR